MNSKLRVMTVLGTRPEIIRLSRTLIAMDKYFDHQLIHTGQNYDYELSEVFFNDLGIRAPDVYLNSAQDSKSPSNTIGNIIISFDNILMEHKPDAILVLGDTNSSLAVIPAKRHKVPIFHIEAGNRCFDQRVPEEINRRIVDHTSDINLTYSSIAREYLLREGLPPDQIIKIGSPMYEVLNYYMPRIEASTILNILQVKKEEYFLVSAHREENIDSEMKFSKLVSLINSVAEEYSLPVIISMHPRTSNKVKEAHYNFHHNVHILKPLGFYDYVNLQINAKAVLSDSGTITEEASILNFPALNIREAHERPEGMEESAVMMVGLDETRLHQGLAILADQPRGSIRLFPIVDDYSIPNFSDKVIRIIHSYTNYVNRVVWKKY